MVISVPRVCGPLLFKRQTVFTPFVYFLSRTQRTVTAGWKRWIMIGDHQQLPPVIKIMAFQKYSNMEQSLFTRFVHLGVPTVDLDDQGRARASLCNLYNCRNKQLENLPHLQLLPQFQAPNPGLTFNFQLLNVEDFNGVGESEPKPYFYQKLGEAEYGSVHVHASAGLPCQQDQHPHHLQ
ncbi:unnamed protein product [Oncorhynchus mykiss]|uniref:DNA2/NAM7 helicase helicase domain-containing protein n=1 Tax=Oncorhynchus mykiss TaxID=8022 RepID=A0A060WWZ7_ONCMY|nr:unnamed protein product [Oncorhynchus mykiss]